MTRLDFAPGHTRAGSPRSPRVRVGAAKLLLVVAIASGPATAGAQVFLATRPNPEFEIGPLFVRASIGPSLGPVTVDVLWSLAVPPTRTPSVSSRTSICCGPRSFGARRRPPATPR